MLCTKGVGALAGALLFATATLLPGPVRAQAVLAKANAESTPEVRIEVTELKRTSGDTVTLKAVIVNNMAKNFNPQSMGHAYLLDTDNRKKLTVAKDEKGKFLSNASHNVKAGQRGEIWAKFAAPPASVQRLTVVVPKFAPMEDVPLSK